MTELSNYIDGIVNDFFYDVDLILTILHYHVLLSYAIAVVLVVMFLMIIMLVRRTGYLIRQSDAQIALLEKIEKRGD